jgi:PGF-CTERM protein
VSTPIPTPTPSPTAQTDLSQLNSTAPAPRKVFSSPNWDADHETITVTNTGDSPIVVRAWVHDPYDNLTIPVDAGATKNVSTASILTQDNQIVTVGFDALEDGAPIDSYKATFALSSTPTPAASATMTQAPGFTILIALACILGLAYLTARRKKP